MATIWVKTSFTGKHHWPAAPAQRDYLRRLHWHRFNVRVEVEVSHLDREVEFHDLLEAVDAICTYLPVQQTDSCEQMASTLIDRLDAIWHDRVWTVTVDEDGNCGATVHESREPF